MNTLIYHFYYLESQFVGFPLVIRITIFLTMLLAFIYIISILRIVIIAKTRSKFDNRKQNISDRYEKKLQQILFSESNLSPQEIKNNLGLKEETLKDWEKSHISKLMLNLIKQNEKMNLNTN